MRRQGTMEICPGALPGGHQLVTRKELPMICTSPVPRLRRVLSAGIAAGLVGGMVKLGWEQVFPPRTPERDATNPPQTMLEQLGCSPEFTHRTITISGRDVPIVSLGMHFGFSLSAVIGYCLIGQRFPRITAARGTAYGVGVWFATHIVVMSVTRTVPPPSGRPLNEHLSEFFGHAAWMCSADVVRREFLG